MKKKLIVIVFTAMLTLSTVILLPTSTSKPVKTIEIGVISPTWEELESHIDLYEGIVGPEINDYLDKLPRGKGPKLRVEFIIEGPDEAEGWLTPERHLEKIQELADEDVEYFIAGQWSSQFAEALLYINENGLLMVSPWSTAPGPPWAMPDNAFRLYPPDQVQAIVINQMLLTYDEGIEGLVVIFRDDLWGNSIVEALHDEYTGEIVEIPYSTDPIPDFTGYFSDAETDATELVSLYGSDHVGVLVLAFNEGVDILLEAAGGAYPTIYNLPWFGAESMGRSANILADAGYEACHVNLVSAMGATPDSEKFNEFAKYWLDYEHGEADFVTATRFDAAWLIVQAVLETTDIHDDFPSGNDLANVFPDIASRYYGYSGWTLLDENGDRRIVNHDIWGFGPNEFLEPSIINYGRYDRFSGQVSWEYDFPPWEAPDCT